MSLLLLGAGQAGGDAVAPTLQSATLGVDGETLTLVFSEAVEGHDGFTITPSGGAATLAYAEGDGTNVLVFAVSRVIYNTETLTGDYAMGDVQDLSGNALASVEGFEVTNNSEQEEPSEPVPGSSGPLSPTQFAQHETQEGSIAWVNPENVGASDDAASTVTVANGESTQSLLGFDCEFAVPGNATITGIKIEWECEANGEGVHTFFAGLTKDGVAPTGNANPDFSEWPTSMGYMSAGGDTELWGEEWTPADINAEGFGGAVSALNFSGDSRNLSVDHIRLTVYYTTPG